MEEEILLKVVRSCRHHKIIFSQQGSGGERQTNIINVLDPSVFDQYTTSTPGQQNIMNVLSENKFQLKQLVFDNQN